ncbi:uncharacterized protein [Montipora foliosa]|uniref:uncharacterized protein n=1 Tax=Montipora foliosa TaxID=591990 RepID=UPI0035F11B20
MKQQLQVYLAFNLNFVSGVSTMDGFKSRNFPRNRKNQGSRRWGSETDIRQSSLPPIQSNEKCGNSNFKWISNNSAKYSYANRPPTPSPGITTDSVFSFGRTSKMSTSSSSQRLSLSLDLRPTVKGNDFRRHSAGFADHSPETESCSPRMCVRSLPSSPSWSPTVQRSRKLHHRNLRRLASDSSEHGEARDDRIMNWIRDVSQSTSPYNLSIDGDDDEMLFACSLEKKDELGFNGVNGLPVIQEGRKA